MKHPKAKIAIAAIGALMTVNLLTMIMTTTMITTVLSSYQSTASNDGSSNTQETSVCTSKTDTSLPDASETDTVKKIGTMFANKGYSKAATAGVLGNLYAESGLNPLSESHDGGYGIAQWTPRSKIREWLDAHHHTDVTDSDLNGQALMLAETVENGFNTYYVPTIEAAGYEVPGGSLYRMWTEAADAKTAAIAFMAGYERPAWEYRNEDTRVSMADKYYAALSSVTFKTADGTASGATNSGTSTTIPASCSDGSNVEAGTVGDIPENQRDFGWMCSWGGICQDGDGLDGEGATKNFYHANVGRYQCVWYAWNRLAMIHGGGGWTWVTGNGGDVHVNVAGMSNIGWQVSDTPKAGDGVSQYGGALGGTGTYGHIAVVEKVETTSSGWKILISEGNYNTDGNGPWNGFNTRWLDSTQFQGAGNVFFRNTKWER
ncbi:phage tail tip lysozyme [Bifidobacterium sp. SO1]|uniref:phage tail tip lysozyme n=1 Tax=Bifidobacterium sp. SO1 TaxID=2809029 RepID=UPI001BDC457C|nr:phage tail tip lysozyme [Bifidobacterium sp. SO1]MBT1162766.1 CHAP domain-containing protein [Bifidobacterium sp. SO1]